MGAIASTAANGKHLKTFVSYFNDNDAKPGTVVQVTFPPLSADHILRQVKAFRLPNVLILTEYSDLRKKTSKNKQRPFTDIIAVLPSEKIAIGELLDSIDASETVRTYLFDNSLEARNYAFKGVDLDVGGMVTWEGDLE